MSGNPYEGSDLWDFRHALELLNRHREAGVTLHADPVWLLPDDVLPGAVSAYGLDVVRADVDVPMLAYRSDSI